jgi:hypothetical protein
VTECESSAEENWTFILQQLCDLSKMKREPVIMHLKCTESRYGGMEGIRGTKCEVGERSAKYCKSAACRRTSRECQSASCQVGQVCQTAGCMI